MAALDAQAVDALGHVQHVVALEAQADEGVDPLAAGVEVHDRARVPPFADHRVPGAQAWALEARAGGDQVLVEAPGIVWRDDRLAPVPLGDRAPRARVSHRMPR